MCLDVLDKALFVVCLDDTSPANATEMCNNMLCEWMMPFDAGDLRLTRGLFEGGTYKLEKGVQVGTCTNRYYDKVSSSLPNDFAFPP